MGGAPDFAGAGALRLCLAAVGGQPEVIVSVSLPLPLEPANANAGGEPTLRLRPRPSSSSSERTWLLDLEIDVAVPDPEEILAGSEGFLVDTADGREAGMVDRVEFASEGTVSALIVSGGWLGRSRARMEVEAIDAILPAERRIVVRA
jgi:hypothetical protein